MHYLLFYEVDEDYLSKRGPLRDEHVKKACEANERGELVLAGAFANPVDDMVLVFKGDSPEVAEKFANGDPYVSGGAVKRWYIREWSTVTASESATPVCSDAIKKPGATQRESPVPGQAPTAPAATGTILRVWRGRSTAEEAGRYILHAKKELFPKFEPTPGNRGAFLVQQPIRHGVEFLVLTLWDSMDVIEQFARHGSAAGVFEPEATSVLRGFDDFVQHYDVVHVMQRSD